MILRQKLKYLRKQRGMSQLELAEKLKVSRQAVSGWEAGSSKPSTENLQCMSKLYSVSLEYLLDDSQEFPKKKEDQGAERDIITDKSRNTKKAYILIVVGVLAFLLICFVWSSFNSDSGLRKADNSDCFKLQSYPPFEYQILKGRVNVWFF